MTEPTTMSGTELALVITAACSGLATLIASVGGFIVLLRKVNQVERTTNSLASRAEASAHAAGTAEGNLQGREEQTQERKDEALEKRKP